MDAELAMPLQQQLSALHDELSEATDELELVAAVARYTAQYKPSTLRLFYFHSDDAQTPYEAELVATWQPDGTTRGSAQRVRLADFVLAELAMRHTDRACVIADIARDARLGDAEKQSFAATGHAALIVLPCYRRAARTWQGVLTLHWAAVHTPSAEELVGYNFIARLLTAFIANRRAMLAQAEVLRELKLINEVSTQLSAAQNNEQALQAVAGPFIARDAAGALLLTFSTRPSGEPEEIEVIASWRRSPAPTPAFTGQRFSLATLPLWQQWTSDPDHPVLIENINTDARFGAEVRALLTAWKREAMLILPLRTRVRWVGALIITWRRPQRFTSRDHALCRSLANQAAIVLDNRQLMLRMQDTAREHQQQSLALKALLDNMPVGVVVVDAATHELEIINPRALQILGITAPTKKVTSEEFVRDYQIYDVGTGQPLLRHEMPLTQTFVDEQPHHREALVVRGDGQRLTLDVFSVPIADESGALRSALWLFVDISERKHVEAERARIQESLIAYQAAALAERSTPLIPISDEILVLPLIGSLDTARGQQVLDVLLNGVSQSRTRVAIVDVTGVRTLDTQAAQTLTQCAQALRLLGVEPVLTGIRAEVAQTLVILGVPLDGIVTRSTLQSGLAYANRKKSR